MTYIFHKKRVNGADFENRECEQTAKVFLHENAQNFQHDAILPKIGKYTNKTQGNIGNPRFFIEHGKHKFFCRGLIFYVG